MIFLTLTRRNTVKDRLIIRISCYWFASPKVEIDWLFWAHMTYLRIKPHWNLSKHIITKVKQWLFLIQKLSAFSAFHSFFSDLLFQKTKLLLCRSFVLRNNLIMEVYIKAIWMFFLPISQMKRSQKSSTTSQWEIVLIKCMASSFAMGPTLLKFAKTASL